MAIFARQGTLPEAAVPAFGPGPVVAYRESPRHRSYGEVAETRPVLEVRPPTRQLPNQNPERNKLVKLWRAANGRCTFCGVETVLYQPVKWNQQLRRWMHRGVQIDHMATREHLISKLNPLRGKGRNPIVLACYRCNQERNTAEWRALRVARQLRGEIWRQRNGAHSSSY